MPHPAGTPHGGVAEVLLLPLDLPRLQRPDPGQRLQQLRLAVAGDARDPHDLALPQREADALDAFDAQAVLDHEIARLEHRGARPPRRLLDPQAHLAPDHQLGELLRRRPGGRKRRDDLSLPHHGDDVGRLVNLAQLVGDEHDRLALGPERRQHAKEMIRFLWRQHCGRLVEDQQIGAAVERLEDLDALALAHAEVLHARVRVDFEVVFAPEPLELGPRSAEARAEPEAAFDTEHDVFQNGERFHQHEVLVHHADPRRERFLRATDGGRRAAHEDLAAVGTVVAVEDPHQRRLAGAVLAYDAVDRAGPNRQRDIPVRVDLAEPLVDRPELDGRRGGGEPGGRGRAHALTWPCSPSL